jgi:hypothetical protein
MDYDEAAFLKPLTLESNYTACTNSKDQRKHHHNLTLAKTHSQKCNFQNYNKNHDNPKATT